MLCKHCGYSNMLELIVSDYAFQVTLRKFMHADQKQEVNFVCPNM